MDLNQVLLFHEDFSGLPVGTSSVYPSTAEGEYHVVNRKMGRWTEAAIHGSWNARATGNWKVVIEDDRHVICHTLNVEVGPPMMIAGGEFFSDYALEADVRPMSFAAPCGLIVRYQTSRCYDFIRIHRGQLALLHRYHESTKLLASIGHAFDVDRYYHFRIECVGPEITVYLDGVKMLEAEDPDYMQGKVGFWAQAPARFANINLTTSQEAQEAGRQRAMAKAEEEQALRAKLPKPVLWKKLLTPGFGTDRNIRFGDINGDGATEMVITQRVEMSWTDYTGITCITAMDLDGNVLWQKGEPSPYVPVAMSDNCIQLYDINGDGAAELIYCKDLRIYIADGKTGDVIRSAPTPRANYSSNNAGGYPWERILGDSVHICNLRGRPFAQDILIKDRYANTWALDDQLNILWHHESTTGHFPSSFDIDGDGCDEVMCGYHMVDQDGSLLWELPTWDHQDATAIGAFDPDRPDTLLVAQACGNAGFFLSTSKGELLKNHQLGHVQKLAVANVRPDLPGLEYTIITFWGQPGVMAVMNCKGEILEQFELVPYASALTPVNWTMDGQEFLFLSAHPVEGGLIDGHGRRVVMLPDDGHPYYCCASMDLTGDGRDELVCWDAKSIWIYKADAPLPQGKRYRPKRNPRYNASNYVAQVSRPGWEE